MRNIDNETPLSKSTPEREGISSRAISRFLEVVRERGLELHSVMVLRHGHVIAEGWWHPYHSSRPHMLFSMTKSFTGMAVGFALTEGLLSLEDTVSSFFPEIKTYESDTFGPIRVRDLLTMNVGHKEPTMGGTFRQLTGSWVEHFLKTPIEHQPGTRFLYNTGASHLLSAVIQQVSGMPLADYLQPRLFNPLGIDAPNWDVSPDGHTIGASGLSLKTQDIAKFGQFILQKGLWKGRQLLPESWIKEATSCHIATGKDEDNDAHQGYGYQFWRCRHGAVRADGAFGQLCIICPTQDAVIVTTSGVPRSGEILEIIWEYLLPAMNDYSLLSDDEALAKLNAQLDDLVLASPKLVEMPALETLVSGKVYTVNENSYGIKEVSIVFESNSCLFELQDAGGRHEIRCGRQHWIEGTTKMTGHLLDSNYKPTLRVCARAGWRSEYELVILLRFMEAPFSNTIVFRFDDDRIRLTYVVNTDQDLARPALFGSAS